MICYQDILNNKPIGKCKPYLPNNQTELQPHLSISPTTFLFDLFQEKKPKHNQNIKQLAKLLGSVMMNGLPFLDIDDFVHASDFVNRNIPEHTKSYITQSPLLSGQFGNFLNVRNLQIRLSPDNCWTKYFVEYLKKHSKIIKVSFIILSFFFLRLIYNIRRIQ